MINITRWSPDTCDCVMEYSWDTETTEDQRTHSFAKAVRVCDSHTGETPEQAYEKVKEENPRKNKALDEIIKALPTYAKTDAEGNKAPDPEKIVWSFDADRNLEIDLKGAKKADKDEVKAVLINKLPKVKIL